MHRQSKRVAHNSQEYWSLITRDGEGGRKGGWLEMDFILWLNRGRWGIRCHLEYVQFDPLPMPPGHNHRTRTHTYTYMHMLRGECGRGEGENLEGGTPTHSPM